MPPIYLLILLSLFLAVGLIPLLLRWLILPLKMRRNFRMAVTPAFAPVTPEQLTPQMRNFIAAKVHQFVAQGFEVIANVSLGGSVSSVTGVTVVLVNRASGDVATLMATHANVARACAFTVRSHFAEGRALVTGFMQGITTPPRDPETDGVGVSWDDDVTAILEFHRRRVVKAGRATEARVTPSRDEGVQYLRVEWSRSHALRLRLNYEYVEAATGQYRQTLKGAYLMAWSLTEPVKSWRIRRRDLRAMQEWRELGMDRWVRTVSPEQLAAFEHGMTADVAAAVAPADVVVPDADGPLRYESALAPHEIRAEHQRDALIVRIGVPGRWTTLLSMWPTLLSLGFFFGLFALNIAMLLWVNYRLAIALGPTARRVHGPGIWFYVILLFVIFDLWRIARGLIYARGTIVLTAGPSGLTYRNAPAWQPDGSLPRDRIETLTVRHIAGVFQKRYRLEVIQMTRATRLPLYVGTDKDAIQQVRDALTVALGIDYAAPPAVPLPPTSNSVAPPIARTHS